MQATCRHCQHVVEFSGPRPSFCGFCGQRLEDEARGSTVGAETKAFVAHGRTEAAPESVGGYRLVRQLGAGGMGAVYEAEDGATGRRVAVKLISPEFAESADAIERFRQEGRLASVISHPRCVFVLAAEEEAGRPYIVMELMPGSTLRDLVEKEGPLAPEDAVVKILDVLDGLREAHRLGVIHRDVKPSNCFFDADGRVKIGDFGLSRSLVSDSHLTRTGAFLGTPQFASPEQIRRDPLDQQTDVYSVAATLYYLLTGRAPHETNDAAATMARIVADPAPSVRSLRPEISPALDRVIQRGLERQRERRWQTLDEFRAALLPFAPGRMSIGGMGIRFGAYLIDYVVVVLATALFNFIWIFATGQGGEFTSPEYATRFHLAHVLVPFTWIFYFALLEGRWGCSLGKRLLRLRVTGLQGGGPPGFRRALLRTIPFFMLSHLSELPYYLLPLLDLKMVDGQNISLREASIVMAASCAAYPLLAIGVVLMMMTMRARNGYRGLHEFISATRVVSLPEPERQRTFPSQIEPSLSPSDNLPERIGPYKICGALYTGKASRVLLAEEVNLGRKVVIWLRPEPALDPARREISRPTRWRWLTGAQMEGQFWDAFLAAPGSTLPALMGTTRRLTWPEARLMLELLTDELAAAVADGTLPRPLTIEQVWVQSNGVPQLLDAPMATVEEAASDSAENSDQQCALGLLRRATVLALEGRPRAADDAPVSIRAPIPGQVARCLERLLAVGVYDRVEQFQADLADLRSRPVEVTRSRRFAHLVVLTVFLFIGLFFCMIPAAGVPGLLVTFANSFRVRWGEETLQRYDAGVVSDYLCSAFDPNPFQRAGAAVQLEEDVRLQNEVRKNVAKARQERQAYLQSLGWGSRQYVLLVERQIESQQGARPPQDKVSANFRTDAQMAASFSIQSREVADAFAISLSLMIFSWPLLWILWCLATRGGVSMPLLGLTLVQSDGKPASRLRCGWRALLTWTPVTACLALSACLELWHWTHWSAQEPSAYWWVLWISLAGWWGALALLAFYFVQSLWWPTRALHDQLAGTYVVPR